jgi:hypothetical protein
LSVPQQPGPNGTTATITVQECVEDNVYELTDLKVYKDGPCLETVHHTEDFDGKLDPNATASIYFCDIDFVPLSSARLLAVHEDGHHEILREKDPPCDELLTSAPANPLLRLASRIGDRVQSWIGVRPLMASSASARRGFDTEDDIRTKWKFVEPLVDNYGDDQVRKALAGSTVLTTATVADINGLGVTEATLRWNAVSPAGASVHPVDDDCDYGTGTSDDVVCTTNGSKNIQVEFQLDAVPGTNIFTAHGRDHADPRGSVCSATFADGTKEENLRCNGPRDGADPFTPIESWEDPDNFPYEDDDELAEDPIPDDTKLTFTVIACNPIEINGIKGDGEWDDCVTTETFTANVSGGKQTATFYWARLGGDLYFAVKVPVVTAAEKEIKLTLYLSDLESGTTFQAYDDVLVVDGTVEAGEPQFSDNYLWDRCPKGKSFCALVDDEGPNWGDGAFSINPPDGEDPFYFFEVMQAVNSESDWDIDARNHLGVSLTLRIGKGRWGNTDWPAFGEYKALY